MSIIFSEATAVFCCLRSKKLIVLDENSSSIFISFNITIMILPSFL